MKLLKNHLDIGMFTPKIEAHDAFWSKSVGLRLDQKLQFNAQIVQHRYDAHDSVIKVNHHSGKIPDHPHTGYVGLAIASADGRTFEGRTPEGDSVRLVRSGHDGIVGIGITVRTPDPDAMMRFYCDAMEFERVERNVARCGDTLLFVHKGGGGKETDDFVGLGFRYLTVQIQDADVSIRDIVARGGRVAREAVTFPGLARYGFVKDPDGNWIEISARKSLGAHVPEA